MKLSLAAQKFEQAKQGLSRAYASHPMSVSYAFAQVAPKRVGLPVAN